METAEYYFNQGLIFSEKGENDKAIGLLKRAIEINPYYTSAYNNLGIVYYKMKDFPKAIEYYKLAIEKDPNNTFAYNEWGNVLLNLGKDNEAQAMYEKCIEINPGFKWAYYNMGLLLEKKDPEKAIGYYKQVIEKFPDYTEAYNGWGSILLNQGKDEEAQALYEKCLEINPEFKWALYNLGVLYEKKDPRKAIEYYKRTIEKDPNYAIAYYGLGNVLEGLKEEDEALANFKRAIEISPEYADAYNAMGNILYNQGKYEEAQTLYEKCLEVNAEFKWAYINLGRLCAKKDPQKAIAFYRKAIETDPNYTDAYNRWGNVLLDLGQDDEAQAKYEKCIEIDPEFKWAYLNLGILYEKKDQNKAIDYYRQAIEKDPAYANAYNGWADVLLNLGKDEEAQTRYEKCIELKADSKWPYYNLGKIYEKKDPHKAIEYYKLAIEKDPDLTYAYDSIYLFISKIKDSHNFLNDFIKLVESKNTAAGYSALGHYYNYIKKEFEISLSYYEKCKERGGTKDVSMDIANAYESMGNIEKAIAVIESALKTDPGNIYLLHNKAHYFFHLGKYEVSRKLWEEVVFKYEEALEGNSEFSKNIDNYSYCGSIYSEVFGDLDNAYLKYEEGYKKSKNDFRFLAALYQITSEIDKRIINPESSQYWKRNTYLREAEKAFNQLLKSEEEYYLMADLYVAEEDYEKAYAVIQNCLELHNPIAKTYILQSQIHAAKEEFLKAIQIFKKALRLEDNNLNARINLGNVYLRNKNFTEAELEFTKVMQRDPNNVEALIGLGEISLNRFDDSNDTELLETAEKYQLQAIKLGKTNKGSYKLNAYEPLNRNMDRKYKDLKLSDVYYSLGYIKTKQFELNKFDFTNSYLNDSFKYFTKSYESNPDNLKALFAKNKVLKNIKTRKRTSKVEIFGSGLISILAIFIFLICQWYFFSDQHKSNHVSLGLENATYIASILPLHKDSNIVEEIKKLANVGFNDKNSLIEALQAVAGKELIDKKLNLINQLDFTPATSKKANDFLPVGYYVMISFGSIVFLIAGLYLPKLLKLKVGVIEIEKYTPTEINNTPLLGIKKF